MREVCACAPTQQNDCLSDFGTKSTRKYTKSIDDRFAWAWSWGNLQHTHIKHHKWVTELTETVLQQSRKAIHWMVIVWSFRSHGIICVADCQTAQGQKHCLCEAWCDRVIFLLYSSEFLLARFVCITLIANVVVQKSKQNEYTSFQLSRLDMNES